jgi:eukaryotic-like serine/threonine-protein kinase
MIDLPTELGDGRYRVDRLLASGGMAIVLLGQDEELDRPVAIKMLADNLAADDEIRRRFIRESRIAGRLSHPNIVRIYDAYEDERPYFVMEYVDGQSVADELSQNGCMDWRRAAEIASQACAGLEHAHEAGVVHRDVKPSNLLMDGEEVVKVGDFGIAVAEDGTRLTASNLVFGSAPYLAPERLREPSAVTAAADLYSLGVVIYELVAGGRPFPCESLDQIVDRNPEEPPPCLCDVVPDVPRAMDELVRSCLATDPEHRPASARTLAAELSEAIPAEPALLAATANGAETQLLNGKPTLASKRDRPIQWRVVAALLALIAIIVAGLFGGMALTGQGGPSQAGGIPQPTISPSASPAQNAQHLADWLREETQPPGG